MLVGSSASVLAVLRVSPKGHPTFIEQ